MFFSFKVKVYEEDKLVKYNGIVPGENFCEALNCLMSDYFPEDYVTDVKLSYVTDNEVLLLPKDIVKFVKKENNI